jgi:quercetin dioxygenase-like cupin family protein
MRRTLPLLAGMLASVAAILTAGAAATTPSGQVTTILARGTTDTTFAVTVPKLVMVAQKVQVRVKGKLVTRTKMVQKTVDTPIVACSKATPCDVVQQRVTFDPGGFSGWHSHPGSVLVVITAGTLTRYLPDCTKQTFGVGQSFVEVGRDSVILVKNEGSVPEEALVTLTVPAGTANADLRIDQPQPSGCAV